MDMIEIENDVTEGAISVTNLLPQGIPGERGPTGETGPTGATGLQGPAGTPASESVLVDHLDVDPTDLQAGDSLYWDGAAWRRRRYSTPAEVQALLDSLGGDLANTIDGVATDLQALESSYAAHSHALWQGGPALSSLGAPGDVRTAIDATTLAEVEALLNGYSPLGHTHVLSSLGGQLGAERIGGGLVSDAEFGCLDGVTSGLQGQLNGKLSFSGTRTANRLGQFDASGNLIESAVAETGSVLLLNSRGIDFNGSSDYPTPNRPSVTGRGSAVDLILTAATTGVLGGAIGSSRGWTLTPTGLGIGAATPARRLEILDATNPQQRWTHTAGTVYGERQVDSSGAMIENITGTTYTWNTVGNSNSVSLNRSGNNWSLSCSGGSTISVGNTAGASPKLYCTTSLIALRYTNINVIEVAGNKIGFHNTSPVAQGSSIANPTDAASTQAALISLLTYLRSRGDIAA